MNMAFKLFNKKAYCDIQRLQLLAITLRSSQELWSNMTMPPGWLVTLIIGQDAPMHQRTPEPRQTADKQDTGALIALLFLDNRKSVFPMFHLSRKTLTSWD